MRFGGRIWWCDWQKAFYIYDQDDVHLHSEVAVIMSKVGEKPEYVYNGNSLSDKAQIIDMASLKNPERVFIENPFNKHTGYINAKNGVLRLDYENRKVELIGKKPDYMFSYCIDTEYDPNALDTEIHQMLYDNVGPIQREFIYQMVAIAIRDTDPKLIPSKVAYLFIGPRNTGKNVVMQVLNDFFGNAIVSRIPLIDIAEDKFVKPLLEGKVINLDDELPEHLPLTESREIKSLTGGKFHTLNPKNVKPYSGIITALLVFGGNQFPKCTISKNDSVFWDRWEIINFAKKQHAVNKDFLSKLLTPQNLSGFFNRVIQKLFDINKYGIKRQRDLEATYARWMYSSSTVARFLEDMTVEVTTVEEYGKATFFEYYQKWCEVVDMPITDRCEDSPEFGRELYRVAKVKEGRPRSGDIRYNVYKMNRYYNPILLNPPEPPEIVYFEGNVEDEVPEMYYKDDGEGNLILQYEYKS